MEKDVSKPNIGQQDYKRLLKRYIILLSIGANVIGAHLAPFLNFPTFLNSNGTIFTAILLGPFMGGLVGLITGILNGYLVTPPYLYFTPVDVSIGIFTGYIFKKYPMTLKTVFIASIIVAIVAAVVGITISYILFAGSAGPQIDKITQILLDRGIGPITAMVLMGFFANLFDKMLSFAVVFYFIGYLDEKLKITHFKIKWEK